MSDRPEFVERRKWLTGALIGGIVATLAAISYPIIRFLRPRRVVSSGAESVVAPYKVNELRPDADGQWPEPFNFGGKPCLLILTPDGEVKAFNAICTHTDCTVKFRPEKDDIFCNCHNGLFNLNGRNVSGPPPRPLESYKVDIQGKVPRKGETDRRNIIVSRT